MLKSALMRMVGSPLPERSLILPSTAITPGHAQAPTFVAPPRTIADITAILDREKPDPAAIAKLQADAHKTPPTGASRAALAQFYFDRGNAHALLGQVNDAISDAQKAVELGQGAADFNHLGRYRQFLASQLWTAGEAKKALQVTFAHIREADRQGPERAHLFGFQRATALMLIQTGDLAQAENYVRRNQALLQEVRSSPIPGWRAAYPRYRNTWEADVEMGRAFIFEARGQLQDAEAAYVRAEALKRASLKDVPNWHAPPPKDDIAFWSDGLVRAIARSKMRQGRLAEAEADARRALLARLSVQGKYHARTPSFIVGLADILIAQGRFSEAEKLIRVSLEIQSTLAIADDKPATATILARLGAVLNLLGRPNEAAAVHARYDRAVAGWDSLHREAGELDGTRVYLLYAAGQVDAGVSAAQALLKRQIARFGEKHVNTATARGALAIGLAKAGRKDEAIREFRAAIPALIAAARENADDDTVVTAARNQRLQAVIEAYIALIADGQQRAEAVVVETFGLADAIRGQSVQSALTAASARMAASDPALGNLARKFQDLTLQVNALLGLLNNALSLPAGERDEKGVKDINAQIDKLRAERDRTRAEIQRRFPSYAALIDPKAPTIDDIKAALKPDEALLSFYFGREHSFVWALSKSGPVTFAAIAAGANDVDAKIKLLRQPFEAPLTAIETIPSFDLKLAHELYAQLLQPVEQGWRRAKSLIVVTNGALGLLPLGLLPTGSVALKTDAGPLFSGYRQVPWLARTHAVTLVPSVAAFRTLRQLPPGSDKRERLIGFGDPYFNEQQATEAAKELAEVVVASAASRGFNRRAAPQTNQVDSAKLGQLPRLADTADELKAVAQALGVDPATALKLGKAANEQTVKSTDLAKYQIISFATHGLMPNDLDGLTQPALALTAPEVAGVPGDGLLTVEEILALKLDADWVVLSACNTAAGAVAGAEAASGLGRRSSTPALARSSSPIGRWSRARRSNWCPICSAARLPTRRSLARRRCGRR